MNDLISRKETCSALCANCRDSGTCDKTRLCKVIEAIMDIPPAEPPARSDITIQPMAALHIAENEAALKAIKRLLERATPTQIPFAAPREIDETGQLMFSEQVRGVLILLDEFKKRFPVDGQEEEADDAQA